ncbi:MAG TPA: succinate dehydrogenase, cytochrome b556 subunit [Alphaproteobacteria bacterium]|nr:succinate dehydrogenase, cytochrome b556 subunit [Alphaproteobacteria bacterium]
MSTPAAKPVRPLSPHLQVYRPQLTSVLSILHRLTGVALALGLPVLVAYLVALMKGPQAYGAFTHCLHNPIAQICLFGWSFAFFYHFWAGIRHLCWDSGLFLSLKGVYATGWFVVAIALFSTAMTWAKILGWMG